MYLLKTILVIFSLILLNSTSHSQIIIHRHLTTDNGLAQGQISAIEQDSKGYIWFGTFDGVSRWDGQHILNIQTYSGMPASQILDIEESSDSTIYIAAYGGGVLAFKNEITDTIDVNNGLLTNNIIQIKSLKNGEILIAGDDGNINKLKDGALINWSEEIDFPKYDIFGIYEHIDGKIYFATENGLVIVDDDSLSIITENEGLITNYLWSVNGDKENTIYIGTNLGINKLKNGKLSELKLNGNEFRNAVFKINVSADGKIYYATNAGILIENNVTTKLLTTKNGLLSNDHWSLFEADNGLIYFGSNGKGASIYDPNEVIVNFDANAGIGQYKILAIEQGLNEEYYLGTRNGLLVYNNERFEKIRLGDRSRANIIEVVHKNNDGELLLGTKNGLKTLKNNSIKPFINKKELINNEIYSIAETQSGKLFIGTRFGVFSLENKDLTRLEYFDSLGSIFIMSLLIRDDQSVYFGSFDKGLIIYEAGEYITITYENGLSSNRINCLHEGKNGNIYVGTQRGLTIIKDNVVIDTIDVDDGLSNNVIADINEDNVGRIFLSTFQGLNILNYNADSSTIRIIDQKDGLLSNESIINGSYVDKNGKLWIATQNGISIYNPLNDIINETPPKIYFSNLQIYNEEFPLKIFLRNPELNYDQNYLKFTYTGINLSAPTKINFKYRLSGIDNDWVTSKTNDVQYTSLDGGNYTFEVKASNEWGYWSDPTALTFTINPAWWETWWFYMIAFLSISGLIAFITSYRYRHLLAIEKVRTKISEDLHDNIGSGLAEITFLSEMVKSQVKENDNANKGLNNIAGISKTLIDDMRDIVWLVNPSKDTLQDLFNRLQDSYQEALKFSEISLIVDGIQNLSKIRLPMSYRQNIFLLFKEGINNSIKYSECRNILVNVNTDGRNLKVGLKDDGKGFDINETKLGNGIKNMKKRANSVNGNLEIQSQIGKGTRIEFSAKFSKLGIIEV